MNKLQWIRNKLTRGKVYAMRTLVYASIFNSIMVLFLSLSTLNTTYKINIPITKWFIPMLFIGGLLLIVIGWVEDKLGVFKEEASFNASKNQYFIEIKKELDEIRSELKRIN